MDIEFWERLLTTFSWFAMVWFTTTGLSLIVLQFLLPAAANQIRANPPTGAGWAHSLWYGRERIYAVVLSVCILLGLLAAALYVAGFL